MKFIILISLNVLSAVGNLVQYSYPAYNYDSYNILTYEYPSYSRPFVYNHHNKFIVKPPSPVRFPGGNVPVCATYNGIFKTFANIHEFSTAISQGHAWTFHDYGWCPRPEKPISDYVKPICAAYKSELRTFSNSLSLEEENLITGKNWVKLFDGVCPYMETSTTPESTTPTSTTPALTTPASTTTAAPRLPSTYCKSKPVCGVLNGVWKTFANLEDFNRAISKGLGWSFYGFGICPKPEVCAKYRNEFRTFSSSLALEVDKIVNGKDWVIVSSEACSNTLTSTTSTETTPTETTTSEITTTETTMTENTTNATISTTTITESPTTTTESTTPTTPSSTTNNPTADVDDNAFSISNTDSTEMSTTEMDTSSSNASTTPFKSTTFTSSTTATTTTTTTTTTASTPVNSTTQSFSPAVDDNAFNISTTESTKNTTTEMSTTPFDSTTTPIKLTTNTTTTSMTTTTPVNTTTKNPSSDVDDIALNISTTDITNKTTTDTSTTPFESSTISSTSSTSNPPYKVDTNSATVATPTTCKINSRIQQYNNYHGPYVEGSFHYNHNMFNRANIKPFISKGY